MNRTAGRACLAALVLIGGPAVARQLTFSSRVEIVRVDALVTDGGQPVLGLRRGDFEILDNGVPQQIDLASFEELPLNVTLALDTSASVTGPQLDRLKEASLAVIDGLTARDRAALVTFNHMVSFAAPLTTDLPKVKEALRLSSAPGNTAIIDGAYAGLMMGAAESGRSLLVVFTDGVDTASWLSPKDVLDAAKRLDVVTYAVAAGGSRQPFLRALAETTGGAFLEIGSTKDVGATFQKILSEFRQRYLLSFTPRGVSKDGWHKLEVRLKGKRGKVIARSGYLATGRPPA